MSAGAAPQAHGVHADHVHVDRAHTDDPLSRLSIVLPVGPGETAWPPVFEALRAQAPAAELLPVFVEGDPQPVPHGGLRAPAGRARQQNAGAAAATRPWLWFVHADSRLTEATLPALRRFLAAQDDAARVQGPGTLAWGTLAWFRLRFEDDAGLSRRMRFNAAGADWRSRVLGLPFGDQGLLLRARDFAALGGFDTTMPYGEDLALVWRARRAGLRLHGLDAALLTSARRYRQRGWLRTTLRHLWLTVRLVWRELRR